MSNDNQKIFPKFFDEVKTDKEIMLIGHKDWIIVNDDDKDCERLIKKMKDSVLNPGNLYYYGKSFAINVNASILKGKTSVPHNIWGEYGLGRIINVKHTPCICDNEFDIKFNSVLWKDVKRRNIIKNILKHMD